MANTTGAFNPNWAAFAAHEGLRPEDLPIGPRTNAAFMAWINKQATEFTAHTGISKATHPGNFADRFSEWLTDAYPADDEPEEPQPYYDGGRLMRPGARP